MGTSRTVASSPDTDIAGIEDIEDIEAAVADARAAIDLVQSDPERARQRAMSARGRARGDPAIVSMCERALGLAAKELNQLDPAAVHLRRSVRWARRSGCTELEGEARMSLGLVLAYQGRTTSALRELAEAGSRLVGLAAARVDLQRALVLTRLSRYDEALDGYRRAQAVFRRCGDKLWEARLLCNRGALYGHRLELAAARADLERGLELSAAIGQDVLTGGLCANLGEIAFQSGDIPWALSCFDRAEALWQAAGIPRSVIWLDRCRVLLSVGLFAEARASAEEAVAELARHRMSADLAEARLVLADAALLDGDYEAALETARRAERAFRRQNRPAWAILASYVGTKALVAGDGASPATLRKLRALARALAGADWPVRALDARLSAARMAVELGRLDVARAELAEASRARRHGPVGLRVGAWHAEGLLRMAEGRPQAADQALRSGLRLLDLYRATLGGSELRAASATHRVELALDGLGLALEAGRPERILTWAERARAGVLHPPSLLPPPDPALADQLAALRQVAAQTQEAALAALPTAGLRRRQAHLEEAIRRKANQAPGGFERPDLVPLSRLRDLLGSARLVELIEFGPSLRAVVVDGSGPVRLVELGPVAQAEALARSVHFALRRMATGHGSPASQNAAAELLASGAKQLDQLVLEPVAADLADRPLVIIPTGSLHALAWGALPTCADRAFTIAPSASLWALASERARVRARADGDAGPAVVLVAGPGLPGADAEIAELARQYPAATVLTGAAATVDAVRSAFEASSLVHLAAHGRFRSDNPLFSSLLLADGPLTVYDLERLRSAPSTVILSACDGGMSAIRPGEALMGVTACLLELGTSTLVASVAPVRDDCMGRIMRDFHRRLRAGSSPAPALAAAGRSADDGEPASTAARFGLVCMGAG